MPDKPTSTGWGGRIADLLNTFNSSDQISMSISIAGKNTFQVGNLVSQYAIGTGGATKLAGSTTSLTPTSLDGIRFRAQKDIFAQSPSGLFEAAFASASGDAIVSSDLLNTILTDSLDYIAGKLEGAPDLNAAIQSVLKEIMDQHGRVIFNGNGYSEEWHAEAAKRGLLNLKTTAEALPQMLERHVSEVFE